MRDSTGAVLARERALVLTGAVSVQFGVFCRQHTACNSNDTSSCSGRNVVESVNFGSQASERGVMVPTDGGNLVPCTGHAQHGMAW